MTLEAGNPYRRGRLKAIDLLLLTNPDQLLLTLEIFLFIFNKTSYLDEEVHCTESPPSVRVPCFEVI
jgi:hypothetical protein